MASTVLVVEDETKLRDLVRSYLEHAGFSVLSTGSGAEALELHANARPDLVVLDLGLPDVTGEAVATEIRRTATTPILVLTAKATEADRVAGLELGVDDYLTKPFSPRELVLRVQAILRRTSQDAGDPVVSFADGELVIDEGRHQLSVRGEVVVLTPTEWGLLTGLASAPERVFSRAELANRARGYDFDGYERTIDSHIKNLRRKIERDPIAPELIVTVTGAGYRLAVRRDH